MAKPATSQPTFTAAHYRTIVGRLTRTEGVTVSEYTASPGCTPIDAKKLAAAHSPRLAQTMREVGGARLRWQAQIPGWAQPITGALNVPDGKTLLKHGFAAYRNQRAAYAFPPDLDVALVDAHNDSRMAWLVVEANEKKTKNETIRWANAGEENASVTIADSLDAYLLRGVESAYLSYWQSPEQSVGDGKTVADEIAAWRALPIQKRAVVVVKELDRLDAGSLNTVLTPILKKVAPKVAKALKGKAAAAAAEGAVRLRVQIESPDAGAFGYHRAASVLADAPGSAPFLAACGVSDPRFDLKWSSPDVDGFVTAIHRKKTPLRGAGTLDVELVLSHALVPGLTKGAEYEAVVPYRGA